MTDTVFLDVVAAEVAERIGRLLTVGFGRCDLEGRPLTDLQKIDIGSAALLCFDGFIDTLHGVARTHDQLTGRDVGSEAERWLRDRTDQEPRQ